MFAVVEIHVDFFNRNLTGSEGGFKDCLRFSDDCVDTTVVAWIDINVNQFGSQDGVRRIAYGVDNVLSLPFAKVRNAFNNFVHFLLLEKKI